MPIDESACGKCGKRFEVLVSSVAYEVRGYRPSKPRRQPRCCETFKPLRMLA